MAEADDFEPGHGARQINGRTRFPEAFQLVMAVEILRYAEAHDMGGRPEHGDQRFDVIVDERLFIAWIELTQFFDHGGNIDLLIFNTQLTLS